MSNIDYLIQGLRLEIGDINPATYRYTDEWLDIALVESVKALQRWWSNRYLVDSTNTVVSRNPDITFNFEEPPIIETSDERVIILMASIIIKKGSLENSSWNTSTWRDAEYYVSNIEGGKMKESSLAKAWEELLSLLKSPQRRLNAGVRIPFDFGADETT